jgi:lysine-N-methylase
VDEIREYSALRYMTRFQCLGGACEDPCCRQWQIPVDALHYRAMEAALGDSPDGKLELERAIRKLPVVDQTPERVGDIAFGTDGFCTLLQEDKLCSLHRRFGEDVLADTCATYPRAINRLGASIELSGATSCPQVARLCLLADDAVDVVPLDPATSLRRQFILELEDPDQARLLEIRDLLLGLLRQPFPLASRQMFLAAFAHRTAGYLGRGMAIDQAALDATLASFRDRKMLEGLHRSFVATSLDHGFVMRVVLAVLEAEPWPRGGNFGRLIERVLSRHAPARKKGALDAQRVAAMFRKRRDEMPAHLIARMEQYLRNFAISNLYQEWYTAFPSVVDLVQLNLVQGAVLQFLLVSHPETSRACKEPEVPGLARLDAAVVECLSYFSRAAHHSAGLGQRIVSRLAEGGFQTPEHTFALAAL